MLRLPAEAADAQLVVSLGNRNLRKRAALCQGLRGYVVLQGRIRETLDKAITEGAKSDAERFDSLGGRDVFDDVRISRASMN
jgi:hypothetical protein